MNDLFSDSSKEGLSREGRIRREKILDLARREASRNRRRRGMRTTGLALLGIVTAASLASVLQRRQIDAAHSVAKQQPPILISPTPPAPSTGIYISMTSSKPMTVITTIHSDPAIAERMSAPIQPAGWRAIGDDALLKELADAGVPGGLAYVDGRAMLLLRDADRR